MTATETLVSPLRELGATLLLLARSLVRPGPRGAFGRQVFDLLVRTVPLNIASMAFVGAVVIVDGGRQVQHLFGDPGGLGPAVLEFVVREFGPAFGGVIAATRIGSGIAAEIAAMKVSEQIDALELSAVDPVSELLAPRTRAAIVALFGLGAVSILSAAYTGAFTAAISFGSRPGAFLDTSLLDAGDFSVAGAKLLAFGLAIPAVATRAGMTAAGGAPAVGQATTRGVVYSIVAVVVLDLVIGGAALAAGI
jgi:phospholipid/cholesterol/gamma-HCH transport system permease protein